MQWKKSSLPPSTILKIRSLLGSFHSQNTMFLNKNQCCCSWWLYLVMLRDRVGLVYDWDLWRGLPLLGILVYRSTRVRTIRTCITPSWCWGKDISQRLILQVTRILIAHCPFNEHRHWPGYLCWMITALGGMWLVDGRLWPAPLYESQGHTRSDSPFTAE